MNFTDTLTGSFATDTLSNSIVVGANITDLRGGWDKVWGAFTSGWPGFATFLTVVGVLLLVIGIVASLIQARRQGEGSAKRAFKGQTWTFVIAAVLAGPQLILPVTLGIFDLVINVGFTLYETIFNVKR